MEFSRQIRRGVGAPRKTFPKRAYGPKRLQSSVEDAVRSENCEAIYRFRQFLGMSRDAFGALLGVSWWAVMYWEHGKGEPHKLAWASFCRVRANYRRKMKKIGKDLDGGPAMGKKL
jgi:hypothetical protein